MTQEELKRIVAEARTKYFRIDAEAKAEYKRATGEDYKP